MRAVEGNLGRSLEDGRRGFEGICATRGLGEEWEGDIARPSFLLAEAARSECAPSMRAVKDSLATPLSAKWRKSAAVPAVLSLEASLTHVRKFTTMLENPACRNRKAAGICHY